MAAEQPSTFGMTLRQYREAAGLSQEDLAERAGVTVGAIGALERGERRRPYPHTLQLLARALELDDARRSALIATVPGRVTRRPIRPAPASTVPKPGAADFVGRRDELAILQARLTDAAAGQGGMAVLVGEAGIGKTFLARRLADDAQEQGATVLWGCCFEGDWQPPYGPWVDAVGQYASARDPERLRQDLGPGAFAIAHLVPQVHAAFPEVPPSSGLSPDEERYRLYHAVVQLLLTLASERPVLVVLDDLHWADTDSLRLLRHVARLVGRARVLILAVYRDPEPGLTDEHPLFATMSTLQREVDCQRLTLRGFSREEVGTYLAHTAGNALPQALVKAIEQETGGNPFYAREVFRHLTEDAKVLQRDGRWSTDFSIGELGIPEGVRQVVGQRVARLSHETGELLTLASGFTGGFGFDVLGPLSGLPEGTRLDCLDEALHAGLIRVSGQRPPRYEFAHAIVRHALHERLNPDRRARLHRRIALALEEVSAGRSPDNAAELAAQYHASAALPGGAHGLPYALRAAEQARTAFAHERAATFLRMALDLAAESPAQERADILCRLAIAEAEAVRLNQAQRSAEQALEAMRVAGATPETRADFLATVGQALKHGGAASEVWEPLVERGLALLDGQRDLRWARLVLLQDQFEPIRSGPVGGARWIGRDAEAVAVARSQGDEQDYARTLEPLDWRDREQTRAVLNLARSWSQPLAIMRALDVAGRDLLYRHGDFHEARAVYEELLAVSERFGSIPGQGEALAQVAASQIAAGELNSGVRAAHRAQEVIAQLGTGHRLQFVATGLAAGLAYFLDGDWTSLAEATAEFATSPQAMRSPWGIIADAHAALCANRAGNLTSARLLLRHCAAVLEHIPPMSYAANAAMAIAAMTASDLREPEFGRICRLPTLEMLRAGVGDSVFGPLELPVAQMAALRSDVDEAQEYFERARNRVDQRGLMHMLGIVDYEQARALIRWSTTDNARIAGLLDAAAKAFRACGMLGWAERVAEQQQALTIMPPAGSGRLIRYPAGLTAREVDVLRLLGAARTNREIAAELVLSIPTVERHVANIYAKIGASRRIEAAQFALNHGLGPDSN